MSNAEVTTNAPQRSTQPVEKLYMENTLLRVAGVLFSHDAKRAATRTQEIIVIEGALQNNIIVRPDPRLGQPAR